MVLVHDMFPDSTPLLAMTGPEWKSEDVAAVIALIVIYFTPLNLCQG
jgi:hypothetical protein